MATNIKRIIYFHDRMQATAELIRAKRLEPDGGAKYVVGQAKLI